MRIFALSNKSPNSSKISMDTKYKYYLWINPTKSKKEFIKEHDGGFVKRVNVETGKTEDIIFIDMVAGMGNEFMGFHLYRGKDVPFKGEIDETDIEITKEEWDKIFQAAMLVETSSHVLFSEEMVEKCNEQIRKAKEARAEQNNKTNKK